jgi:hypothetical protein
MATNAKEQNHENILSDDGDSEWSGEEEDEGDQEERLTKNLFCGFVKKANSVWHVSAYGVGGERKVRQQIS